MEPYQRDMIDVEFKRYHGMSAEDVVMPIVMKGGVITLLALGGFMIWSIFAPLSSAAIAPGKVIVHAQRKTIQHLEGGVIAKIAVEEGDAVIKDQPLIYLNNVSAKARDKLYYSQWVNAKITEARLKAERKGLNSFSFDISPFRADIDKVKSFLESQKQLFTSRTMAIRSKKDVFEKRILRLKKQIEGYENQISSIDKQIGLVQEEEAVVAKLLEDGNATKPRLLDLKRTVEELRERKNGIQTEVLKSQESIAEVRLQILDTVNEFINEIDDEQEEIRKKISDLEEQMQASGDVLSRTIIRSPQDGQVTGLKYHTVGGVIRPGEDIMDIVPDDDLMIIEAKVNIADIDSVRKGLSAEVLLSAYKARYVPKLDGVVTYVSADRFEDPSTGESYFLAHVNIDQESLQNLEQNVQLYPGMPAEVFIITGERTFWDYIVYPLTQSLNRAFRED